MTRDGIAIIAKGEVVQVLAGMTNPLILPNGDAVHCAEVGFDNGDYKVVDAWRDEPEADAAHRWADPETVSFDGTKAIRQRWLVKLSAPEIAVRLANRKIDMAAAIDVVWEEKTYAGFKYDFGGEAGVKIMQTRQEDQARWLALKDACNDAAAAGQSDARLPIALRPADNSSVAATFNECAAMLRAMRSQQMGLLAYSWELKNAVTAATDHAALDEIDINAGWPG